MLNGRDIRNFISLLRGQSVMSRDKVDMILISRRRNETLIDVKVLQMAQRLETKNKSRCLATTPGFNFRLGKRSGSKNLGQV